jgi:hypothetical protein
MGEIGGPASRRGTGHRLALWTVSRLRQIALAAKTEMLLRFQLRHPEQEAEHVQPVATRESGKLGEGFGNEGRSLVRPTLAARFIALRPPLPARGCARPPASCAGQKIAPKNIIF